VLDATHLLQARIVKPDKMTSSKGPKVSDGARGSTHQGAQKEQATINDILVKHLSWVSIVSVYFSYTVLLVAGYMLELLDRLKMFLRLKKNPYIPRKGYAPLFKEMELFWLRRCYQRIRDLFERPICTAPQPWFKIMLRKSNDSNLSFYFTGEEKTCLNLCSYNYLGFSETQGPIVDAVTASIRTSGVATASPRMEGGNYAIVQDLERTVAKFVGKPDALVFAMGYATNSTTIPAICGGKGTLIISDTLNHASIVTGSRDSGAKIRVFEHNDMSDLEKVLRDSIIEGQPRTHRPWKKIIIIVEGVYSMEGEICKLPEIVALKKKYKAYLYVDEAHSIGALGATGRGVCEHHGVNPEDIDVLMGTFTKAFGSVGGYIAASEELITYFRHLSYGTVYATAMSPPTAQQALSALKIVMGEDGTTSGRDRIKQLHDNSNYFRESLQKMGFHIIGDKDSPVVPMMVYHPAKMPGFSRALLERGLTVVVVGFPVTPLLLSRVRFCISAAHTHEDLEWALKEISELGDLCNLKYGMGH
jgi:serine palmitoyltransferase